MASTLATELGINAHESNELAVVLTSFFPRGSNEPGSAIVECRTDSNELALRMVYDASRLTDVLEGPGLTADLRNGLREHVEDAFAERGQRITRTFLFSLERVAGGWRSGDRFQILPVPTEAPDAVESYADHPFILEYPYAVTPHVWLKQTRIGAPLHRWRLLLNLFLDGSITWP
jgi:hypothetical protein